MTVVIATSQLNTWRLSLLFLELEGFLQPKFQRATTVRQRSVGNISDIFFHTINRVLVLEGRNQKLALHLLDLLLAEKKNKTPTLH